MAWRTLVGEAGRRALLEELLMAALARAVPLAEPDGVAVAVGEDLHLDVAGPGEVALEIDLAVAEGRPRPRAGPTPSPRPPRWRRCTTFMPRPPPPKAALIATGQPLDSPNATTSAASRRARSGPERTPRLRAAAASRALILSPIVSIASGGGPTKVAPAPATARAKAAFSARKPYPGCTASAPLRATTSKMRSVAR